MVIMKKFILILISILLLSLSFTFGFFVKSYIDNKKFDGWVSERKNLEEKINDLETINQNLSKPDNPIDAKAEKCIAESTNAADVRNCVYLASEEWEKEITKYLDLLQKSMTAEKYKLISDSQNLWRQQSKKDNDVINEFVFNHGGTLYYDLAADDYEEIIKKRAEFLKWIYEIHTDKIP